MSKKKTFNKGDVIMRKTLSLILAVLMIVATMPVAFAAETLSSSNVSVYPTISPTTFYYGQTVGDITVNDDEVVLDAAGNQVVGSFICAQKATLALGLGENQSLRLKFVPDSTTDYSGFTARNTPVIFSVLPATPVFVDEANDPIVAGDGQLDNPLSLVELSGGAMYNPYNADDATPAAYTWQWKYPDTILKESGMQTAIFTINSNYTPVEAEVFVNVVTPKTNTEIVYPSGDKIISIPYDGVTTMADLEANANALDVYAVEKGTDTRVAGTFTVVQRQFDYSGTYGGVLKISDNDAYKQLQLVFTPDDTESYNGTKTTEPVTLVVTKGLPAWTEGEAVITVPYGTEIDSNFDWYLNNELDTALKDMLKSWSYKTIDGAEITDDFVPAVGTHEVTANLNLNGTGSQNWQTDTMMIFTLVVEATVLNCEITYAYGGNKIVDNSLAYDAVTPTGTFTIVGKNGDEVVFEKTVKYGEIFKLNESTSGKYVYSVKYNPVENDAFIIADFVAERDITLKWNATIDGKITEYAFGDTVEARTVNTTDFTGWTATDAEGNPVTLTLVSGTMENDTFTFVMPDHNVVLTPEFEAADDNTGGGIFDGIGDIDGIDGFFEWFANLFAKIKAFFEKIIEFFQSIGDMT